MNYQTKREKLEAKLQKLEQELQVLEEKRKIEIAEMVLRFKLDRVSDEQLLAIFKEVEVSLK